MGHCFVCATDLPETPTVCGEECRERVEALNAAQPYVHYTTEPGPEKTEVRL